MWSWWLKIIAFFLPFASYIFFGEPQMGTANFSPKKSVYQIESVYSRDSKKKVEGEKWMRWLGKCRRWKRRKINPFSIGNVLFLFCQCAKEKSRNETLRCVVFLFILSLSRQAEKSRKTKKAPKVEKLWVRFVGKDVELIMLVLCKGLILLAGLSGEERGNLTTNLLTDRSERRTDEERGACTMCATHLLLSRMRNPSLFLG